MTPDDDHDGLAAEYVLGTLDAFEREQVEALMAVDAGFLAHQINKLLAILRFARGGGRQGW